MKLCERSNTSSAHQSTDSAFGTDIDFDNARVRSIFTDCIQIEIYYFSRHLLHRGRQNVKYQQHFP